MIRSFSQQDVTAVLAIQRDSPGAAQWSESDYWRLAEDPGGLILVAEIADTSTSNMEAGSMRASYLDSLPPSERDQTQSTGATLSPRVAGFAAFHRVLDEAELRNMAVLSGDRRRGLGRTLLDEGHRELSLMGVERIYLEVRAGNAGAIRLYEAAGYRRQAIRRIYYQAPDEDAWVMSLELISSS